MNLGTNTGSALLFLVDTLFQLYLAIVLLRIVLQLVRADFYNPLAQFIWRATQPVVYLQRAIPYWQRLDSAALLLAWLLACVNVWAVVALSGFSTNPANYLLFGALKLVVLALNLYSLCIFVQVLISWLGPGAHSPATSMLWSITEPLLRPVRRYLPPLGGLDFSPLLVLLALQVVVRLIPLPVLLR